MANLLQTCAATCICSPVVCATSIAKADTCWYSPVVCAGSRVNIGATKLFQQGGTGTRLGICGTGDNKMYIGPNNDDSWGYVVSENNSAGMYFNTNQGNFQFDTGSLGSYTNGEVDVGYASHQFRCGSFSNTVTSPIVCATSCLEAASRLVAPIVCVNGGCVQTPRICVSGTGWSIHNNTGCIYSGGCIRSDNLICSAACIIACGCLHSPIVCGATHVHSALICGSSWVCSGGTICGATLCAPTLCASSGATIGSSSSVQTTLTVRATNTAGAPGWATAICMEGYEGRGIGTFFCDVSHAGRQWFSGMNYAGGFNTWNVGHTASGGQAEYSANTLFRICKSGIITSHNIHYVCTCLQSPIVCGTTAVRAPAMCATNFCASDWFRNTASGTGLYNTVNDNHFHSAGPNYWHINSKSGCTSGALVFYNQHNGSQGHATGRRGYVYWDSTANFGLLSCSGNWAVKIIADANICLVKPTFVCTCVCSPIVCATTAVCSPVVCSPSASGVIRTDGTILLTGLAETNAYNKMTIGGGSDTGGYSRAVSIWASHCSTWESWVGTNLIRCNCCYFKATDHSGNNWGNLAGIMFRGGEGILFVTDAPGSTSTNLCIGTSLASRTRMTIANDGHVRVCGVLCSPTICATSCIKAANICATTICASCILANFTNNDIVVCDDLFVNFIRGANNNASRITLCCSAHGSGIGICPNGTVGGCFHAGGEAQLYHNGSMKMATYANGICVTANSATMEIYPHGSWNHLQGSGTNFYFNKALYVDTGKIGSYNEDLCLHRAGTIYACMTTSCFCSANVICAATCIQSPIVCATNYVRAPVYGSTTQCWSSGSITASNFWVCSASDAFSLNQGSSVFDIWVTDSGSSWVPRNVFRAYNQGNCIILGFGCNANQNAPIPVYACSCIQSPIICATTRILTPEMRQPAADAYLDLLSGCHDSGYGGIVIKNCNGSAKGYVYWGGTNYFGLLDCTGSWRVQLNSNTDIRLCNVTCVYGAFYGSSSLYGASCVCSPVVCSTCYFKTYGSGRQDVFVGSTSGHAAIYLDGSNGDFSGSDYSWVRQNDDKSFEVTLDAAAGGQYQVKNMSNTCMNFWTNNSVRFVIEAGGHVRTCFGLHACSCVHTPIVCATTCVRGGEVCATGWFRNGSSGVGLYNAATGQHWYSDHDDYWNIAGGTVENGLRFRDEHNGTIRGTIWSNNSNQIGFQDSGGNVRILVNTSTDIRLCNHTCVYGNLFVSGLVCTEGVEGDAFSSVSCKLNTVSCFNTTCSTGYDAIYDIYVSANPNSGGSGAYRDVVHMTSYVTTGYSGSAVMKYINTVEHFSRGNAHDSGGGPVCSSVHLLVGLVGCECYAQGCNTCLQVRICGGNTSSNAANRTSECVLIKRVL